MGLVIAGLNHQHYPQIRHVAIEITVTLFKSLGLKLIPYLQDSIPQNLTELLNVRFSEVDPENYDDDEEFDRRLYEERNDNSKES